MSLAGLLPLLRENEHYQELLVNLGNAFAAPSRVQAGSLPDATVPYLLASVQADLTTRATPRRILVITARPERARTVYEGLRAYAAPDSRLAYLPTPDLIPYERIAWDSSLTAGRLMALQALAEGSAAGQAPVMVVGGVRAIMQPTMPPADFRAALSTLRVGQPFDVNRSLSSWLGMGYQPASLVEEVGQFSRRGGIVDLWPATYDCPIRIELFGDEIESLRRFEATTQRSNEQAQSIIIAPACEIPFWRRSSAVDALGELDLRDLRPEVREEWQYMMDTFRQGDCFEGMELFLPYFSYGQPVPTALDYLQPGDMVVIERADAVALTAAEVDNQASEVRRNLIQQRELPPNLLTPYVPWPELEQRAATYPVLEVGERADELEDDPTTPSPAARGRAGEGVSGTLIPANSYAGRIERLVEELRRMSEQSIRCVIVSQQAARLREMLEEQDVYPVVRKVAAAKNGASPVEDELDAPPSAGSIHLLHGVVVGGWQLSDPATVLLTDSEIFGWTPPVRRASRRTVSEAEARTRNAFISQLQAGQYIVHIEHGIGRFAGLVMREVDGVQREYMLLEYAEGDRLYVPSEQTDRVLPYTGVGHQQPTLTRLGTAEWTRTKRKVRESTEQLARELLTLYSQRELAERPSYGPDNNWQGEMESAFPYVETEDQMRAIDEVKADMLETEPMDRLVCGDVGYGKTEVAMRAAFKAVMAGKQVAVLVPTTLLAQQHYESFRQRMGTFPVEIEMLSRFRNRKQQQEIAEQVRTGKVDILIGTHRILQKDVQFKNLGMIVVDEEQRFGVKHKEQLKQLRTAVDVLTLTATPIPRTLHMAMVGVRDMSVIETPPADRLPIKTYVTAYTDQLVREVILRELQRGGQVFFVHNKVMGIGIVLQNLQKLVPEARFGVGHGQMNELELEQVMEDFIHRRIDVLLCTTIIESGLDIPNANTLIVEGAENFGLAQLYQLRGRVGRGANRAYAYFLYHKGQHLSEEAQERLQAIQEATELGAGFRVALRDLEIRGAGNLLGAEQSGHIGAVGFDLYTRLLANAVERARNLQRFASGGKLGTDTGHAQPDEVEGQVELAAEANLDEVPLTIDLPLSAYLPTEYVSDNALRLRLYQRLARPLSPLQSKELAQEIEDRFGELPVPARNLLYIVQIKGLGIKAGADSISTSEGEISLRLSERTAHRLTTLPISRAARRFGKALRVGPRMVRFSRAELGDRWPDALKAVLEELGKDRLDED